jgi:glutamate synthase (NADPH/NADH) large chain
VFARPDVPEHVGRFRQVTQNHNLDKALDNKLIELSRPALYKGEKVSFIMPIRNVNRTVGTMLAGEVALNHGHEGLPDDTIHIQLNGTAGQSFGAFAARGMTLDLVGEGNDYVGKGLSGGTLIVRPTNDFRGDAQDNIIVGNTVLYGAIEGEAYFSGVAGERFCVRNSGATAVIEGTGDHCCEYMTGGTVVVLGPTGRNFGAGMSGGIAYVYDRSADFERYCNPAMVAIEKVLPTSTQMDTTDPSTWHKGECDEIILKNTIQKHFKLTGSARAGEILENWDRERQHFVKVFPHEYRRALGEMHEKAQQAQHKEQTV